MSALIYKKKFDGVKLKIANRKLVPQVFKTESGFSLTEVLMAAGILAIGFMMIATLFPVGMKMTATATERTVASVAADEAFAKIRLFGIADFTDSVWATNPPSTTECVNWNDVSKFAFGDGGHLYPSIDDLPDAEKRYSWSALCSYTGTAKDFQVTVLISRKTDAGAKFPYWRLGDNPMAGEWILTSYPRPVPISGLVVDADEVDISIPYLQYFPEGSVVIDNSTGWHTTVLERDIVDFDIRLTDAIFEGAAMGASVTVWVIPPAVRNAPPAAPTVGGRDPCIGVYQRVIGF